MGDATVVDLATWERDMRINVTSMLLMAQRVIPEVRKFPIRDERVIGSDRV